MENSTWHESTSARRAGQKVALGARHQNGRAEQASRCTRPRRETSVAPPPSGRRSPHQRLRSSAHLLHRLGLPVGDALLGGRNVRRRRRRRGRRSGSWRKAAPAGLGRRAGRRGVGAGNATAAPSGATRGAAHGAAHHRSELGRVDRPPLLGRPLVEVEALAPRLGFAGVDFSLLHVEDAVIDAGPVWWRGVQGEMGPARSQPAHDACQRCACDSFSQACPTVANRLWTRPSRCGRWRAALSAVWAPALAPQRPTRRPIPCRNRASTRWQLARLLCGRFPARAPAPGRSACTRCRLACCGARRSSCSRPDGLN